VTADLIQKALIAAGPVLVLLTIFDRLDVFNLIRGREIGLLMLTGGVIAGLCYFANVRVLDGFPIGYSNYSKYVAPLIEETLKAAPIAALFHYNRLGYKLDAAIAGFALGAGFSLIENAWYLIRITDANISGWLVRGFGTAIMHGGATAIFAVITHEMTERQAEAAASRYRFDPLLLLPGLGAAILIHGAFNHFPDQPLMVMAMALLLIPVTLFFTLVRNERATGQWLTSDAALHKKALDDIRSGVFAQSEAGRAIQVLAARLGADAAQNAMAYVELKTELVLRAEELIRASQSGAPVAVGEGERDGFARLQELERKLGPTATTAIDSRLAFTRNDLWELGRLRERAFNG
jgi:RsiW-degrading membrane proteinase PrsW (M82 family)